MNKQRVSVSRNSSVTAGERAAAALDRATWLEWSPKRLARDYQLAHALVDAVVRSDNNGPVQQRVALNVRNMR